MHIDWERRCVVLDHIHGTGYPDGYKPSDAEIDVAFEFVRRMNSDLEKAKLQITMGAAEGYLRLTEHVENVSKRLTKMCVGHLPTCYQKPASTLVTRIQALHSNMADKTMEGIQSGELSDAVEDDTLCISPSDFGFHNAIRSQRGIKFIDFEFAGWDDPAKLISDFALQPKIPVKVAPPQLIKMFRPNATRSILERCATLGPLLRIKWLCIILAVLDPERLNQLIAIHPDQDVKVLTANRLELAITYLNERSPFGLY
jgi:hypothetical protein